jgi:UDP-N-acetylglucosamine 2-epimerase
VSATYVVTLPNVDPGAAEVRAILTAAAGRTAAGRTAAGHAVESPRIAVDALGERRYWGLLRIADALLGNSSSAIVEAPAFDLPAVDVGDRQAGRRREANVIDAPADADAVAAALRRALEPAFRTSLAAGHPTLLDGRAGARIAAIIAAWRPPIPPRKPPIVVDP